MSDWKVKMGSSHSTGIMEHLNLKVAILISVATLINYLVPQRVFVIAFVIAWLLVPFVTLGAEFLLMTFSPLRKVPQPKRSLLMGFGGGALTGVFWLPFALNGDAEIVLIVVGILLLAEFDRAFGRR